MGGTTTSGSDQYRRQLAICLSTDEQLQLWDQLAAAASDALDEPPEDLGRPTIFAWAVRELLHPDCNHMADYYQETGDGVVCLRCQGDDGTGQRRVEREAAGGPSL